ncbi:MAG: hypothetical protein AAF614_42700, partial [Chloroflexota bacterium]
GPQASDLADPTTATTISTLQLYNAYFRKGYGRFDKNGRWEIPIAHAQLGAKLDVTITLITRRVET